MFFPLNLHLLGVFHDEQFAMLNIQKNELKNHHAINE